MPASCSNNFYRLYCAIFIMAVVPLCGAQELSSEEAAQKNFEEIWLALFVNGEDQRHTALLRRDTAGRLYASERDWRQLRLRPPQRHEGEAYYPLDDLSGLSYRVDAATQNLYIEAPPSLFLPSVIQPATTRYLAPTPAPPGGFFNYDLFARHAAGRTQADTLLELGAFRDEAVATGTFLGRDLDGRNDWLRLETTLTHDRPAQRASLRLGDAVTRAGSWGRAVRFGGAQWTTNFATQPGFIAFPLPVIAGEAALPSTLDLYANDALRLSQPLPPGPFEIAGLPVVTGQGELRLVVRDLLGREQILSQQYYASPSLLRPGLHDFSYEAGWVRENFALASNDYGRAAFVATHRMGFTERFTGEAHAEFLRDQQSLGLSGVWLHPAAGVFTLSAAGSHSDAGDGGLFAGGFERISPRFSLSLRMQAASPRFAQLGLPPGQLALQQELRLGFSPAGIGSLGLSYTRQDRRDGPDITVLGASYSRNLGGKWTLQLTATRVTTDDAAASANNAVFLTLTRALDSRTSATLGAAAQDGVRYGSAQVQRNLPVGAGIGYRVLARAGDVENFEAGVSAQNGFGTVMAEASRFEGENYYRAGASGGVALLDGELFFSRRLSDSFAVVQAGYPGVQVYADNQPVARTDAGGRALVPRLRPYDRNRLRLDPADLPLDAHIGSLEQEVAPYFRAGVITPFAVSPTRGALLRIVLEDGAPLPIGAVVHIKDRDEEFPVALDGEVYVTGLAAASRLRVSWRGQVCEFDVPLPPGDDPLPDLGTFLCAGMRP